MTNTAYVRAEVRKLNKESRKQGKLKLASLYGKMLNPESEALVRDWFKNGTTHCAKWEDKDGRTQK